MILSLPSNNLSSKQKYEKLANYQPLYSSLQKRKGADIEIYLHFFSHVLFFWVFWFLFLPLTDLALPFMDDGILIILLLSKIKITFPQMAFICHLGWEIEKVFPTPLKSQNFRTRKKRNLKKIQLCCIISDGLLKGNTKHWWQGLDQKPVRSIYLSSRDFIAISFLLSYIHTCT